MADLPHRIEIVPWGFWKSVTGLNGRSQASSNLGGGSLFLTANPNSVTWEVLLDAGTWALDVIYGASSDRAIFDFLIDGSSIGTVDAYAATLTRNVAAAITGITLAAGHHVLRIAANGKNAASADYFLTPFTLTLTRTGA